MKKNKNTIREITLDNLKTFKYLDFNREIRKSGIKALMDSIQNIGVQRLPVIVYTNIITGNYEYFIIDGQHLVQAMIALDIKKVYCAFVMEKVSTKDRLVEIISMLNITARNWQHKDYLHAWKTIDKKEYKVLDKKIKKYNKFTVSDALRIYSTTSKKEFEKGVMKLGSIAQGDSICENLLEIFPLACGKSSRFIQGYVNWRNKTPNYKHKTLLCKLKCHKDFFTSGETPSNTAKKLDFIYKS